MTDCNECGNMGYTLKTNDEGVEYMDGCNTCLIAALEADNCPEDDRGHDYGFAGHRCLHCNQLHPDAKTYLKLRAGSTRIDVRKEAPRGVAYTFGGLS